MLVPSLLALQAWRFLRLGATPLAQRLAGVPRCSAAELGRLARGSRAVVEGALVPPKPGAALPSVEVHRRARARGGTTLEAWRERASAPPVGLRTGEGVVWVSGGYGLRLAPGEPVRRSLREGDVACALVTLEAGGGAPRVRAEWLQEGPLSAALAHQSPEARWLLGAVVGLLGAALLGALGWWMLAAGALG